MDGEGRHLGGPTDRLSNLMVETTASDHVTCLPRDRMDINVRLPHEIKFFFSEIWTCVIIFHDFILLRLTFALWQKTPTSGAQTIITRGGRILC